MIVLLSLSSMLGMNAIAQTQVSVTIPPLYYIALAVTDGIDFVAAPHLILDSQQSHHHPVLRPSQRRAIAEAQVLLWIGPEMEGVLEKVVGSLDADVITALELEELKTVSLNGGKDPHVWLDTDNARLIARTLATVLGERDVENKQRYLTNLRRFNLATEQLDIEIKSKLSTHQETPFAVYHNAFQYYEAQFGLQHIVSFTDDEEFSPAIRRLLNIKRILQEESVKCLITEPETNIESLSNIIEDPAMRYVSVDVIGNNIEAGKDAYIHLMQSVTDAIVQCLR